MTSESHADRASLSDATIFALDEADKKQLLIEQTECTLSWTNKAGHPVSVTCGFVLRDDAIWMASTDDRVRTKALRRDPRAALTVSSSGTSLGRGKTVSFKGNVDVVDGSDDLILEVLHGIIGKMEGKDNPDRIDAHVQAAVHQGRCLLKFNITQETSTFDSAKTEF